MCNASPKVPRKVGVGWGGTGSDFPGKTEDNWCHGQTYDTTSSRVNVSRDHEGRVKEDGHTTVIPRERGVTTPEGVLPRREGPYSHESGSVPRVGGDDVLPT